LNRFEARVFLRAGHPPAFVLFIVTHSNICASDHDRMWGIMDKISNRYKLNEITLAIILMLQTNTFSVDNEIGWNYDR